MDSPYIWISCYAGEYTLHAGGMGRGAIVILNSYAPGTFPTMHGGIPTFQGGFLIAHVPGYIGTDISVGLVFNFNKEYEVFDAPITPDVLDKLKLAERWIMITFDLSGGTQTFPAKKTAAAIDSLSAACTAETE
jgi:hypothetical protein